MELLHKLHVWNSYICQGPLPRVLLFCEYQSHIKGGKGKFKENIVLQSGCRDVAVKLKAQPQPLKDGYYLFFLFNILCIDTRYCCQMVLEKKTTELHKYRGEVYRGFLA